MESSNVLVVVLRQPRSRDPNDKRSDPFWEFGSFGLTGCHGKNVLHPKKAGRLKGTRLAFVQGGGKGFRLVYLSPPVSVVEHASRNEAHWQPPAMPFCYDQAPVVIDERGFSDVPELVAFIDGVNRNGWQGKFASKFRSRCQPLPGNIARGFERAYNARLGLARRRPELLAETYDQALPVSLLGLDRDRAATYRQLLAQSQGRGL